MDLLKAFNLINPHLSPSKLLNHTVDRAENFPQRVLRLCPLHLNSCYVAIISDGSFKSHHDPSFRLGYVIFMAGKNVNANIQHFSSVKPRKVARSALTAELSALVYAFDQRTTMRLTFNNVFNRKVYLALSIDSKSFYKFWVGVNEAS